MRGYQMWMEFYSIPMEKAKEGEKRDSIKHLKEDVKVRARLGPMLTLKWLIFAELILQKNDRENEQKI